jgi:hypothetical protein
MWCIATDPSHMTKKEILSKIWYDLVQDLGNYDHSVPLILLIIEFFINNIPFTYSVFVLTECFLVIYVIFQWVYCSITHKSVYPGLDWNKDFTNTLLKGMSTTVCAALYFLFIVVCVRCKYWANGIDRKYY